MNNVDKYLLNTKNLTLKIKDDVQKISYNIKKDSYIFKNCTLNYIESNYFNFIPDDLVKIILSFAFDPKKSLICKRFYRIMPEVIRDFYIPAIYKMWKKMGISCKPWEQIKNDFYKEENWKNLKTAYSAYKIAIQYGFFAVSSHKDFYKIIPQCPDQFEAFDSIKNYIEITTANRVPGFDDYSQNNIKAPLHENLSSFISLSNRNHLSINYSCHKIPKEFALFSNLLSLNINVFYIDRIVDTISELNKLESLCLHGRVHCPNNEFTFFSLSDILTNSPAIYYLNDKRYVQVYDSKHYFKSKTIVQEIQEVSPNLGKLNNLKKLILTGLRISSVPVDIFSQMSLRYLDIADNALTSIDLSNQNELLYLNISLNKFKSIPEIGSTQLIVLDALENEINEIDPVFFQRHRDLKRFDLSSNLVEQLKIEHVSLRYLNVEENSLQEIEGIQYQRELSTLILTGNSLTEASLSNICNITSLVYLELELCNLKRLPDEFADLVHLTTLFGNGNPFESFPSPILRMNLLETLDLSFTNISVIPAEISNLSNLKEFTFNNNSVDTIPKEIGNLQNLKNFSIQNNNIRHNIPVSFYEWNETRVIDLTGNPISKVYAKSVISLLSKDKALYSILHKFVKKRDREKNLSGVIQKKQKIIN